MGTSFAGTSEGMALTNADALGDVHDPAHNMAQCMKNPKSYVAEVDGMGEEMNLWNVRERTQIVMANVIM